ncbi:hypothetical protein AWM68_15375 [Fictibacillus phosphorivorans]|uniref:Uncharacterized protein n=1 Tax=Fictibacillus phosphorivorans TaxID=1221500 RepID=A0A163PEC2_9BACL|nr:hypothetical protein [Fictibacillus phosphorivorans]KZE63394.1 hypothetical protein AWM68_15375 [Fictibacillus phosphorivorans]
MGYILPYIPIQRMQYASRMEKPEQGLPVVSYVPPIQNNNVHTFNHSKKLDIEKQRRFDQILSEIEGKGLFLNETI